jgi:23S rRNA (cytosine1962-C5)-methyltransferase
MSTVPTLTLPQFLEAALGSGHPWVYRDHVPPKLDLPSGTIVQVTAGKVKVYALWDRDSPIALRVLSRHEAPSAEWVRARVRSAWELRSLVRSEGTTAFRWLFGEGDGLPGITVDLYGAYAVVLTYADGLEAILDWVVEALSETTELAGILARRHGDQEMQLLWGKTPPADLSVSEHGVRLFADPLRGQKTGLFLDHRENRRFVHGVARGLDVLNLFSYTGAFSVHAALGGAKRVTSVDTSAGAMDSARENFRLNGLDPDAHEFVTQDAFEYLDAAKRAGKRYDLVISDPPSFAKDKQQTPRALESYERLHGAVFRVTSTSGFVAAASCTSRVTPEAFRQTLANAATKNQRRFQIVHEAGQAIDHPVMAQHLEGRYLKFVVGRVLGVP